MEKQSSGGNLFEHLESFGIKIKTGRPTLCQLCVGRKLRNKQRKENKIKKLLMWNFTFFSLCNFFFFFASVNTTIVMYSYKATI